MTLKRVSTFMLAAALALCALAPAANAKWGDPKEIGWVMTNSSNVCLGCGGSDTLYNAIGTTSADDTTGSFTTIGLDFTESMGADSVLIGKVVVATDTSASVALTCTGITYKLFASMTPNNWTQLNTAAGVDIQTVSGDRYFEIPIYAPTQTFKNGITLGAASMIMPNLRVVIIATLAATIPMARAYWIPHLPE